jgi:hypothetical protein
MRADDSFQNTVIVKKLTKMSNMLHHPGPLLRSLCMHAVIGVLLCLPLRVYSQSDPIDPGRYGERNTSRRLFLRTVGIFVSS